MITINHKTLGPITFDNGTSREEIANYLVEVDSIVGEQYGIGDTLGTQFGRSMGSSIRSIKGKLGLNTEVDDYEDQVAEYESRKMFEQNPVSSFGGMLAGGFADPITLPALALKPISFASKVGTYAARGGVQGGLGGLLEPTYDQYGDSTVLNIMAGVTLGSGLGAGVGKLVSKYGATPKGTEETSEDLKETSQEVLGDLYGTTLAPEVRTRQQAIDKITEELELEAAGAPTSAGLGSLKSSVDSTKARISSMNNVINRMKGDQPLGSKVSSRNAVSKAEAQKIEAEKQLQDLELKYEEGKVLRKAAKNLKLIKNGQFSKVSGIEERFKALQTPMQRTPLGRAVNDQQPTAPKINPFNSSTSRILGTVDRADDQYNKDTGLFEPDAPVNVKKDESITYDDQGFAYKDGVPMDVKPTAGTPVVAGSGAPLRTPDTAGASRVQGDLNQAVGEQMLPRTVNKPAVTQKLVDDKFKGDNPETSMPMKESRENAQIRERINRKQARGEELSQEDLIDIRTINDDLESLSLFKKFVQKIAGSRALDTAAIRGLSKGRYTFQNIGERAELLLKKNGIEDMEDMANYILSSDKNKIFSAEEMDMLTPLLVEAERRLVEVQRMTRFSDVLDDNEIAALHSEINLYYGISAFNKGQGTKVSATLNHRRKMLQDIADGREISSLWAGRSCK
tara:strand:- start:1952 stop:3991 length:2040 start_codon:yes stop_codon:yes gene_type:complete